MSRSITIEDLYAIKFLSRPRISPDGQRVAFVVTTIDERKHEYRASIWVAPTAGGEARRFTGGTANAHSPCWSPMDAGWPLCLTVKANPPAKCSRAEETGQRQTADMAHPRQWRRGPPAYLYATWRV